MNAVLKSIYLGGLGLALVLEPLQFVSPNTLVYGNPAIAQSGPIHIAQQSRRVRYVRRNVSGRAPAGRYRGGGTRNPDSERVCPAVTPQLTALVPFEEKERSQPGQPPIIDVWGYTTTEHPTLWFYVPYTSGTIPASFSIQEEDSATLLYETSVTLPNRAGIIGIRLPTNQPGLQVGKRYRWFFGVDCKPPQSAPSAQDSIYVEGLIIRASLDPAIAGRVRSITGIETVILYAENGIWFDALTVLAELRRQNPQDPQLLADWKALLSGMPLSEQSRATWNVDELATRELVK
jgi:hypothetical protein